MVWDTAMGCNPLYGYGNYHTTWMIYSGTRLSSACKTRVGWLRLVGGSNLSNLLGMIINHEGRSVLNQPGFVFSNDGF